MAALRALEAEGISVERHAAYVAGHSLGEYSALAAAGSFRSATRRGCCACAATPCRRPCRRASAPWRRCSGSTSTAAEAVASEAATADEVCEVANDNAPGQVVVSGHKAAVERATEIAKGAGRPARDAARRVRAVPLRADGSRRRR